MMRLPAPQIVSIGADIVHLPRLVKSQEKFARLLDRILHPLERLDLDARYPDWKTKGLDQRRSRVHKWFGGRFAAKEAAKKAWGATLVGFEDLRVDTQPDGDVQIICTPFRKPDSAEYFHEQAAKLTISHDGDYAIATVLASPLHDTILAELGRRKAEADKKMTSEGSQASITPSTQVRDTGTATSAGSTSPSPSALSLHK